MSITQHEYHSNTHLIRQPSTPKYLNQPILSIQQFTRSDIDYFIQVAQSMKRTVEQYGTCDLLKDKLLTTIFYEPSTRTSSSFQAAMLRLGGKVCHIYLYCDI